jgi:predicted nucleic acid-binding protein
VEPFSELFDTNILIDHLNGVAKATREIRRSHDPATSVIKWIEMMTGAASPSETILRAFLSNFRCLGMTREVAERAAVNRRQKRIKMPDAIILATAEAAGRAACDTECEGFSGGDSWG